MNQESIPVWDKDGVWMNISGQLQRKKRRRMMLLLLSGLACLLVGILVIYQQEVMPNKVAYNSLVPFESTGQNEQAGFSLCPASSTLPQTDAIAQTISSTQNEPTWEHGYAKHVPEITTSSSTIPSKQNHPEPSTLYHEPNTLPAKATSEHLEPWTLPGTGPSGNPEPNPTATSEHLIPNPLPGDIVPENKPHHHLTISPYHHITISPYHPSAEALAEEGHITISPYHHITTLPPLETTNDLTKPITPIKTSSNRFFFLESGVATGSLTYNSSPETNSIRSSSEDFRFQLSTTIGFEQSIRKGTFFRVGLSYQQLFHSYQHTETTVTQEQVHSDSASFYRRGKERIYYPGLVEQSVTNYRSIAHNNILHRASLPLLFGYQYPVKKARISAAIGTRMRLFQHFKGIIANPEGQHQFDESYLNQRYYKADIDFGLMANLGIRVPIAPRTQLGINLQYENERLIKLPVQSASHYETWGVNVGVWRKF